ncbi:MAG: hypothetical protein KIH69_016115 [Anaerolineae bacterium]|nr:hypothetical protein [Anaerolineae bacterium]
MSIKLNNTTSHLLSTKKILSFCCKPEQLQTNAKAHKHLCVVCAIALILISHLGLSLVYSVTIPIFEAYDESGHFAYAKYIATNKKLPPMRSFGQPSVFNAVSDQSAQPPTYYLFAAIPLLFLDVSADLQPQITAGGPTKVVPDPQSDAFPYQNTALAIRVVRLLSIALGTLAVFLTYLTVKTLYPANPKIALMATAIHAWWPQFISMNSTITNDIGVALGASVVYWLSAKIWTFGPQVTLTSFQLHKYLVGLAIFSLATLGIKGNGAAVILYSFLFLCFYLVTLRRQKQTPYLVLSGLFGSYLLVWLLCFALAWLFAQPIISGIFTRLLFNMSTGQSTMSFGPTALNTLAIQLQSGLTLSLTHWSATFKGMFAAFSWGGLGFSDLWYRFAMIGIAFSIIGLGWGLIKDRQRLWIVCSLLLFGAFVCVGFIWLVRFVNTPEEFKEIPGRYIVPSIGALSVLFAIGLQHVPAQYRHFTSTYAITGLAITALAVPFILFIPTYRPVQLLTPANANIQNQTRFVFGDIIRLLGYNIESKSIWNNCANVTLFWQSQADITQDYGLLLESPLSNTTTLKLLTPAHGTFPTSKWKSGDTFQETYCLSSPQITSNELRIAWIAHDSTRPTQVLRLGITPLRTTCDGQPCQAKITIKQN